MGFISSEKRTAPSNMFHHPSRERRSQYARHRGRTRSLRPKSRLATSRSSSRRWPHLGPRRLLKGPCVRNQRKTAATKDLGNAGRVGTVWTRANRQQNPIDSPNNPQCVMDAPMLGSLPFKIRPSEFLPAPLSPATPFLPHVFRPNSFFTDFPLKANS